MSKIEGVEIAALRAKLAEAVESAVKAVGPNVKKIKEYLTGGMAGDQEDVCRVFAGKSDDKFAGIGWKPSPGERDATCRTTSPAPSRTTTAGATSLRPPSAASSATSAGPERSGAW